jgi:protein involved in polysaccharide export with SLBB domain
MTFSGGRARGIINCLARMTIRYPFMAPAWAALLGLASVGSGPSAAHAAPPVAAAGDQTPFQSLEERASGSAGALAADAPIEGRVDPDTYRVGPGDEFALRYSDLLDPKILRVGPSGDLLLPDAGAIAVAGLSLREAEARIRGALQRYVRGKGFVIALHRPRRFRLPVLGDVVRPGVVTLQAPVRASEAIEAAGGIGAAGASRGIQVRRGGDTLLVDLVRYIRAGDQDANPLVFETDVIYVPSRGRLVEIQGAVPHPGEFDFLEGDRATTLIALGGGLKPDAAIDGASLVRFQPGGARETVPLQLLAALESPGGADDARLAEGDRLFIPARSHWREVPYVWVDGEVARPGPYSLAEGEERIRSLLVRAGGYTVFADSAAVRVERILAGSDPDTAFLRLALDKDQILSPADRSYVLMKSRERNALSAPVGALLSAGDARGDVLLRRGDRIVVPRRVYVVSVQGEVGAPGHVPYEAGRDVDDYVKAAGGYSSRAYKSRVRVTLAATGRQVGVDESRPIMPGDVIWVPTKPERNPWSTIRDIVGVTAAAAAIVLAVEAVNQ